MTDQQTEAYNCKVEVNAWFRIYFYNWEFEKCAVQWEADLGLKAQVGELITSPALNQAGLYRRVAKKNKKSIFEKKKRENFSLRFATSHRRYSTW